jgi:hypothetical protein
MILGSVSPSSVCAASVLPSEVARRPAISVVQESHAQSKHDKAKRNKKRIVFPPPACLDCMKRTAALLPRETPVRFCVFAVLPRRCPRWPNSKNKT